MKVKKIILTMVSTLILCAIAFSQTSYAATVLPEASVTNPLKLVSLKADNYSKTGEYQYSIGNPGNNNAIVINRIGQTNGTGISRIYDAYCARADKGFDSSENRPTTLYETGDTATIDTYNAKINMVTQKSQIDNTILETMNTNVDTGVTAYDAMLQLTNLLYLEEDDFESYRESTLKAAINAATWYKYDYDQIVTNMNTDGVLQLLTEDQVRTVQQAALWYFSNCDNTYYNKKNDNAGWLYVLEDANSNPYQLASQNASQDAQVHALYNYLIDTAIANAKAGKDIENDVYLYTNTDPSQKANTQPVIMIKKVNKQFDLALRKFINKINDEVKNRKPVVKDATVGEDTTAEKDHSKTPLLVAKGDIVLYTIRIYNEGEIAGTATEVADYLPEGLDFVTPGNGEGQSLINLENGWSNPDSTRKITTAKLAGEIIQPLNNADWTELDELDNNGKPIYYRDLQVECRVNQDATNDNLRNIAEITEDTGDDIDSDTGNVHRVQYRPTHPTTGRGEEDDDDFEDLRLAQFDLALRKFIYTINDEVKNRKPVVKNATVGEETTAEKDHSKTPLQVAKGDIVVYTIRVYNEGEIAGTATEVADYLPEGLEFVTPGNGEGQSSINLENGWSNPDSTGKITTDKLAGEVIQPLNNADWTELDSLDNDDKPIYYRDLQVECKVKETATNDTLRNIAEITEDTGDDIDSDTGDVHRVEYHPTHPTTGRGEEDDDDFEDLRLVELDLALRKFITRVADNPEMTNATPYDRAPQVSDEDILKLYNGQITTAEYKHQKNPLEVNVEDFVEYTLRVYNEGSMEGYAKEITDHLPKYLKYVDCPQNTSYGWETPDESDLRTIKTKYLDDTKLSAVTATTLDNSAAHGKELKVICQVVKEIPVEQVQTNIAEITLYGDKDRNDLTVDRDSQTVDDEIYNGLVDIPDDKDLPNYKGHKNNKSDLTDRDYHYKGQQDDDDFEKVYVPNFDLALRKFITKVEKVNDDKTRTDRYTKADYDARVPQISQESYENLINGRTTTLKYTHSKEPMDTVKNDIVTYTIRVYNEGSIDGYASVITDDIPEGVEFLPNDATNITYKWKMYAELPEGATAEAGREMVELNINEDSEIKRYVETTDVSKAKIIRTDYLSRENGARENLIKALDTKNGLSDTNPDYRDVKVAFRVTEDYGSERIIINYAQISEDDNDWDIPDRDSTPDKWIKDEDDQDIEKIKVPQFDLALRKWVTQAIVTENGQTTVTETGHQPFDDPEEVVKVELHRKKLSNVTVKFRYSIRVYNDGYNKETGEALPGYIAGYAKEVKDHIPEGLKFLPEDNPDWKDEGNNIITTRKLENTLLKPGEFADVEVVLTWINGNDNLGLKINYAEISEDDNDWDVPDKDSTPDNMKERHEDDDDEAPVILSVSTGVETTYFILGLAVLITIAGGIALIKKFVM